MPRAADSSIARSVLSARLGAQLLGDHDRRTPAAVVEWMGAIQAQDLGAARWAVGVRLPGSTDAEVASAISTGTVLRTHVFRWTWQLVVPADLRWMLELVRPRTLPAQARRERALGLDARVLRRSRRVLERALSPGRHLTRAELMEAFARGGLAVDGVRLSHLLGRAELEGLVCSGELRGRTPTWALLDTRVPPGRALRADEALREVALRHARGRGPVTAADLAWWAGITLRDARAGLEAGRPALVSERAGGAEHWRAAEGPRPARPGGVLLPAFDEYLVGYRDRRAALAEEHARRLTEGGGMLAPCLVVNGRVVGLWRRAEAGAPRPALAPFAPLPPAALRALEVAARRYREFTRGGPWAAAPAGDASGAGAPLPSPGLADGL